MRCGCGSWKKDGVMRGLERRLKAAEERAVLGVRGSRKFCARLMLCPIWGWRSN
jgi:hypothetical protein